MSENKEKACYSFIELMVKPSNVWFCLINSAKSRATQFIMYDIEKLQILTLEKLQSAFSVFFALKITKMII